MRPGAVRIDLGVSSPADVDASSGDAPLNTEVGAPASGQKVEPLMSRPRPCRLATPAPGPLYGEHNQWIISAVNPPRTPSNVWE